jgi:predicted permease
MLRRWLERLRELSTGARREAELQRELQSHLAAEYDEQMADGASPEQARLAARRALGNEIAIREDTRAAWGYRAVDALSLDLRLGLRLLARHRTFAVFAVASLGLGIGGASAVFAVFDAIVLQELPVPRPEQLVTLSFQVPPRGPNYSLPYPHFERMRSDNATLRGLFAWTTAQVNVTDGDDAQLASALAVTGDYHTTLELQPALGRLLTAADDAAGQPFVAVLSHGYWRRRFGGSSAVLGRAIAVNQASFTVVGVEPDGFRGVSLGRTFDLVVPIHSLDVVNGRRSSWSNAFATWIEVMGRRRPGIAFTEAARDLEGLFRSVSVAAAEGQPEGSFAARAARQGRLIVEPGARGGASGLRNNHERWLRLLLLTLGAVLLLACLNVATLLLARAQARRPEIATRLALGAGRSRLVRQLLTEAGVIAALGAGLGTLLARWNGGVLLRLLTPNNETPPFELSPRPSVIAFTALVSCLSCLVVGVLPALRATSLHGVAGSRLLGGGRRGLERSLVGLQAALSLVLVVMALLFARNLEQLWAIDPGYDRNGVLMFSVDARLAGRRGPEIPAAYRQLLDELRALPRVEAASLSSVRPVSDNYYFIDVVSMLGGRELTDDHAVRVAFNNVGPGFFRAIGQPLVLGRDFDARDDVASPRVAIVSEKLARRFTGNPVGQTLRLGREVREVVGVAKDTRYANVKDLPRDVVYLPLFQAAPEAVWYSPSFEVRHAGQASELLPRVREAVARFDRRLGIFGVRTLEDQTRASLARERLLALLTGYAALFALLLAGIGLYGLVSCGVSQRVPELGLRMALGARPSLIAWLAVRDSALTVAAGVLLGLLGCLAAVGLLRSQLYGLEATDPTVLATAVALLFVLAAAASFVPARRAARIDPMTALRAE